MLKQAAFFLLFTTFGLSLQAQQKSALSQAFNSFKNDPGLRNASIGFCIMNAEGGNVVFRYNDSTSLAPASCLKIVTTGAALAILGEKHVFETKLCYTGNIDSNGALHGNIVIIGGGDPTLGEDRFETRTDLNGFVKVIKDRGIKHIDGKVIVDASYYNDDPISPKWAWDDIGNYFGCGVFGLNYAGNVYKIKLQPAPKEGSIVELIGLQPKDAGMVVENKLFTGKPGSGDQSNVFGSPNDSFRVLSGTIPASKSPFTVKGSLPNPPAWFAKNFASMLYKDGLLSDKSQWEVKTGNAPVSGTKIMDSYASPLVRDIVHFTNLNSINLYAECLLQEIGKKTPGSGSRQAGVHAIKKYWYNKGIDTLGLLMDDGSGLSRYDGITAFQLTKMLSVIQKEKYFDIFLNSLPVSGQSSSMKTMGKGTEMEGKIYCKTGHMDRVRAYSGYFKSKTGKWMSFSLLVNNYSLNSIEIHDRIENLLLSMIQTNDQ